MCCQCEATRIEDMPEYFASFSLSLLYPSLSQARLTTFATCNPTLPVCPSRTCWCSRAADSTYACCGVCLTPVRTCGWRVWSCAMCGAWTGRRDIAFSTVPARPVRLSLMSLSYRLAWLCVAFVWLRVALCGFVCSLGEGGFVCVCFKRNVVVS